MKNLAVNLFHNFTHFICTSRNVRYWDYFIGQKLSGRTDLLFLDEDANDLVIQVKAVLKENAGDISEILLLITPIIP